MSIAARLRPSAFLKEVAAIAGGTALGQSLGVLASPLLTRLYGPEEMGLWGLFVSFLGVAAVLSTLRYEMAIVAVKDEDEGLLLTKSSLVVSGATALLCPLAFDLLRRHDLLGFGGFPPWTSFAVAPALAASAGGLVLRYWAVRKGAFGLVGRFTVIQSLSRLLAQLGLAVVGGAGLFLGEIVGRFAGLFSLWRTLPPRGASFTPSVLAKYRVYPLVQLPSSFLDTLALMAPVPVFAAVYGVSVAGGLALAQRVVSLPLSLIGASVADVFYGRAARLARENPAALSRFLLTTVLRLWPVSLALGLSLGLIAPRVAVMVFGAAWEQAGHIMSAMAPWMTAMLAISPVTRVVFLCSYAWVKLLYDLVSVFVVSSPVWLNISDPVKSLYIVSWLKAGQLIGYLGLLFILVRSMR